MPVMGDCDRKGEEVCWVRVTGKRKVIGEFNVNVEGKITRCVGY